MPSPHLHRSPEAVNGRAFSAPAHTLIVLWLIGLSLVDLSSPLIAQAQTGADRRPQAGSSPQTVTPATRPNILIALSDDQSHPHAGILGTRAVRTPAFDRIARGGVLFQFAFAAAPGCAPSRSSIHTGRFQWQNEEAGGHMSLFPREYVTFPYVLQAEGYWIGHTGKGVDPFNHRLSGWPDNPAGPTYNDIIYEDGGNAMAGDRAMTGDETPPFRLDPGSPDYAANFERFLQERPEGHPFYFFFGANEAHRAYDEGSGLRAGKRLEDVEVPGFLPDREPIRSDMLDYFLEIEWFDRHLMQMIETLERMGELDNTLIIVTSDQGMPFPRAKANLYDGGLHVPLAVSWPARIPSGRIIEDLVSLADIAPTLLEITGADASAMKPMSARSFADLLTSTGSGRLDPSRDAVFAGRERHSSARWANLGYPQRSVRTHSYLYIRNMASERWPAGAPRTVSGGMHGLDENGRFTGEAYFDIDASVSKTYLIEHLSDPAIAPFFELAMGKRPAEELYDVVDDPFQLRNLAGDPDHADTLERMRRRLNAKLVETGDPRVVGPVFDVFENYQRFGVLRAFPMPDWASPEGDAELRLRP